MNPLFRKIYFNMLRIRRVQERIEKEYLHDRMQTPVHLCIGQEAIAAGVCAALEKADYIQGNHRSHGHYLAKGGDLDALVAELHCRETGCSGGFGGSMHLIDARVGHLGSSSIVGGGIPIGTGLALASQMKGDSRVCAVFFGDGAADEGVMYESVNFAMLKKLPAVFVLENNRWSVCSPVESRWPQEENLFIKGADAGAMYARRINGNDAVAVYETAKKAVDRARAGHGPAFLQCDTYRVAGHAGCASQDAAGYRPVQELNNWKEKCPLEALEKALIREGVIDSEEIRQMDASIASEIDQAFAKALAAPFPQASDMGKNLYK